VCELEGPMPIEKRSNTLIAIALIIQADLRGAA